ncbi:MAG: hypothetical protein ACK4TP_08250 [Hyphomicrobium sp.]|jgi:hypothetical protein
MFATRTVLFSLACMLPFGAAGFAAPVVAEATVETAQLTEPAARKGTRNYRPGEDTAPPASTTNLKSDDLSQSEKLAQCMETWDTGTHITKSKWREICIRQLNER